MNDTEREAHADEREYIAHELDRKHGLYARARIVSALAAKPEDESKLR